MKRIELLKPLREDYASDSEWLEACAIELKLYSTRMMQAIDARVTVCTAPLVGLDKLTCRERELRDLDSIHDYLSAHPALMEEYKKHGIGALLEI